MILFDNAGVSESTGEVATSFAAMAETAVDFITALGLTQVDLLGWSIGGFVGQMVALNHPGLVPFLLKTATNPTGAPKEVFDGFRAAVQADRSQWNLDVTMPYYSFNRPGAKVSEGLRQDYWRQGQATGVLAAYHALGAFSETDFRDDLQKITVPALVVHGSDDQIVPLEISATLTAKLIPQVKLVVYDGGSHGLLHVDDPRFARFQRLSISIGRFFRPALSCRVRDLA